MENSHVFTAKTVIQLNSWQGFCGIVKVPIEILPTHNFIIFSTKSFKYQDLKTCFSSFFRHLLTTILMKNKQEFHMKTLRSDSIIGSKTNYENFKRIWNKSFFNRKNLIKIQQYSSSLSKIQLSTKKMEEGNKTHPISI